MHENIVNMPCLEGADCERLLWLALLLPLAFYLLATHLIELPLLFAGRIYWRCCHFCQTPKFQRYVRFMQSNLCPV